MRHTLSVGLPEPVCVTLLDANHCPGAAMFLFEGDFGTVLYTGDFRASPALSAALSAALTDESGTRRQVDYLYFDDTFCDPERPFPSQSEAFATFLHVVERYAGSHRVVIGTDNLGKEELLVGVAERCKTRVWRSTQMHGSPQRRSPSACPRRYLSERASTERCTPSMRGARPRTARTSCYTS